ncbi:PAS domain-containing sensor histidine kinase [Arcobacter arenosus]|uniref:histidine kinase n=1 Tax=Arcobacter arenosus TaxID=2576037 RepID=A0A5R8Y4W1_9BACT|nr:ATP-binding protein [Arcobacter arenosus]TLP40810.1 PAS domain S-box protein [Arcobacter arenosus]
MEKEEKKFIQLISEIPNIAVQGYNKNREVIFWNKASEMIYGYSKEEAIGKKLEDLIIPDFMRADVIAGINNWYQKNVPIPAGKLPLRRKNGTTAYVYSSHVMLNESTNNPEMFCIDIDLTEQVKKDEELKQKDKILAFQSKMASLGEMLDNIAHQWRQPLSSISASASSLKLRSTLDCLDEESLNDSIDSIVKATTYMSNTIEDFRNFVKGTHEKKSFNLYDIIKYSLELLDGTIRKNDINIVLSIPHNEIKLVSFPNELVQVLLNIIANAKDAMILNEIKKRYLFITIKEENKKVYIELKDNAGGIKEDILPKIFEPYFTTKHKSKGTGIGLYMAYKLITESMNGDIDVENISYLYEDKEFTGALFKIVL